MKKAHRSSLRLTHKHKGGTVAEALSTPAAVRKAAREVAEFRRFQEIGHEFVEVNEKTSGCGHARTGGETADAIQREIKRELDRLLEVVFHSRRKTGMVDLEAYEMAVRAAMLRAGAAALTELPQFPVPAASQLNTGNCAPRRCSPLWAK